MYPWLVYLHILGVFGFLMAHGVSIIVTFELRRERNLEHIRTLLNLSAGSLGILQVSIGLIVIIGVVLGFMGKWWGSGWIWLSLGLLIAGMAYMSLSVTIFYHRIRKAVGLEYMERYKAQKPMEPASSEEIDTLLSKSHPELLAAVGFGALILLTWLMKFKPF